MINKEDILDNVDQYSAKELVKYIEDGIVTFEELVNDTEGQFSSMKQQEVKLLIKEFAEEEDNLWKNIIEDPTIFKIDSYLEQYQEGKYRKQARDLRLKLESQESDNKGDVSDDSEDAAWIILDKTSKEDLIDYKNKYPNSVHCKEASSLINQMILDECNGIGSANLIADIKSIQTNPKIALKSDIVIDTIQSSLKTGKIKKDDFLNIISDDCNLLSSGVVKRLVDEGTIGLEDLTKLNIDLDFIRETMKGATTVSFECKRKLEKIEKQSTEIYFWGIPSSGKSCALGAILSVAYSGSIATMQMDTECQGYGYMNELINLFRKDRVTSLVDGTPVDSFYEMGFDLVDAKNVTHPITCIDMAGELMRCMYKANAKESLNENESQMLSTLKSVLGDNRSRNRKMHFFVIEYGAEDRYYDGKPQDIYLSGAVSYIKSTGIFEKDTDAIYLMITKTDKIKTPTPDFINDYIIRNYNGFYSGLLQICKEYEINGGKVEKIAFSLGEVCFQIYCKFNPAPAENVVKIILERTAGKKGGKIGFLKGLFSK